MCSHYEKSYLWRSLHKTSKTDCRLLFCLINAAFQDSDLMDGSVYYKCLTGSVQCLSKGGVY